MPITIGSNIDARRAIRALDSSSASINRSFGRLTSGSRLVTASDDPAGLAVSTSLSTRAKVLSRGRLNIRDGQSALAIADGALSQVSTILTRMNELAAQAANGAVSSTQRKTLNAEYVQLSTEIRRITGSTKFNGISLLSGSPQTQSAQELLPPDVAPDAAVVGISGDGRFSLTAISDLFVSYSFHDRVTGASESLSISQSFTKPIAIDGQGNVFYASGSGISRRDVVTGQITQLTNSSGDNFGGLAVSADGSTLAFVSTRQFADGANIADSVGTGTQRLYTVDLGTGRVRNLGASTGVIEASVRLSNDGSKLVFASNANFVGQNADVNVEIYGFDLNASAPQVRQLTTTTGLAFALSSQGNIAVTDSGDVYFRDFRNLLGTSGGQPAVYKASFAGGLSQVVSGVSSFLFGLSNDGQSLFFGSQQNRTGENPNGVLQAFRYDLSLGRTTQLSNFTVDPGLGDGFISGDGRVMVAGTGNVTLGVSAYVFGGGERKVNISAGGGASGGIEIAISGILGTLEGIGAFSITSASAARKAMDSLQTSIQNLSALNGRLGAGGARLAAADGVVSTQSLETITAAGRIRDADIASESAQLLRFQILQQTGGAVLAQANQSPALALILLN